MLPRKARVNFLIDGFNLYHAIDNVPELCGCKWLNLKKLAAALIMPSREEVSEVIFFTALPPWDADKKARHQRLLNVYEDLGIQVVHGKFLPTTATCRASCREEFQTYAEKMTDINITLEMIAIAEQARAERIVLITGDNDQAATVRLLRSKYLNLSLTVALPPNRRAKELMAAAGGVVHITAEQLNRSILDDPYVTRHGTAITRPINWVAGGQGLNNILR